MSFYQAVAEKGTSYCKGPGKLVECGEDLASLPKADGVISTLATPACSCRSAARTPIHETAIRPARTEVFMWSILMRAVHLP